MSTRYQTRQRDGREWELLDGELELRASLELNGLRYSELSAHVADLDAGALLTADNGRQWRCVELAPAFVGPVDAEWQQLIDDEPAEYVQRAMRDAAIGVDSIECDEHGWVQIVDSGSTPGFCAGSVYWATLSCDCQLVDDASYLES